MPTVKVLNREGNIIRDLELSEKVFGAQADIRIIHEVVKAERAAMRQGTHDTKERGEVRGGGRKPWRQKGTGRARQGTIRAPQWRGGGVVFGPTPRSHKIKCNKKVVRLAKRYLLSDRLACGRLLVVDNIDLETFKTKELIKVLADLKADGKIIIAVAGENPNLMLASRNIPYVHARTYNHLGVYDLIEGDMYVLTEEAVRKYEEELG